MPLVGGACLGGWGLSVGGPSRVCPWWAGLVCVEWGESGLWGRCLSAAGRAPEPVLPGQLPRTAHPESSQRSTMNVVHTFFLKILGIQL